MSLPFVTTPSRAAAAFTVHPALDLLGGLVVRLTQGNFASAKPYGPAEKVIAEWGVPPGAFVHVVDLEASRTGEPREMATVRKLVDAGYRVQVGGGVRRVDDVEAWLAAGAERVVLGTVTADSPDLFRAIIGEHGPDRILPAVDLFDGTVRVAGWERDAERALDQVLEVLGREACPEVLVTDIRRDGAMRGPSFSLYRELAENTSLRVVASGGVATLGDVAGLARIRNVSGVVIGKALHEGAFGYDEAVARSRAAVAIPERIIPCLDVRGGRVVKGVRFEGLRDAGDPVECARRYEAEGADEIVVLDVSATTEERRTSIETIRRIGESLFIPLTVGGGVRSVEDFRALLQAGADRVAINTAAVLDPALLSLAAAEFGVQAVVLACDSKRWGERSEVMIRAGRERSGRDTLAWCLEAERRGAGEILLTSVDRDGTGDGYDLGLLRSVTGALRIGVIASGGAGRIAHFRDAIETGGARAVLAATLFHDGHLTIGALKRALAAAGLPVRGDSVPEGIAPDAGLAGRDELPGRVKPQ